MWRSRRPFAGGSVRLGRPTLNFDIAQILAPPAPGTFPGAAPSSAGEGAVKGDFAAVLESLAGTPEAPVAAAPASPTPGASQKVKFAGAEASALDVPVLAFTVGRPEAKLVHTPIASSVGAAPLSEGGAERSDGDAGDIAPGADAPVALRLQDAIAPVWMPAAPPVPAAMPESLSAPPAANGAAVAPTSPTATTFGLASGEDEGIRPIGLGSQNADRGSQTETSSVDTEAGPAAPMGLGRGDLATMIAPALPPGLFDEGLVQDATPTAALGLASDGDRAVRQDGSMPASPVLTPLANASPTAPESLPITAPALTSAPEGGLTANAGPAARPGVFGEDSGRRTAALAAVAPAAVGEKVGGKVAPVPPIAVTSVQTQAAPLNPEAGLVTPAAVGEKVEGKVAPVPPIAVTSVQTQAAPLNPEAGLVTPAPVGEKVEGKVAPVPPIAVTSVQTQAAPLNPEAGLVASTGTRDGGVPAKGDLAPRPEAAPLDLVPQAVRPAAPAPTDGAFPVTGQIAAALATTEAPIATSRVSPPIAAPSAMQVDLPAITDPAQQPEAPPVRSVDPPITSALGLGGEQKPNNVPAPPAMTAVNPQAVIPPGISEEGLPAVAAEVDLTVTAGLAQRPQPGRPELASWSAAPVATAPAARTTNATGKANSQIPAPAINAVPGQQPDAATLNAEAAPPAAPSLQSGDLIVTPAPSRLPEKASGQPPLQTPSPASNAFLTPEPDLTPIALNGVMAGPSPSAQQSALVATADPAHVLSPLPQGSVSVVTPPETRPPETRPSETRRGSTTGPAGRHLGPVSIEPSADGVGTSDDSAPFVTGLAPVTAPTAKMAEAQPGATNLAAVDAEAAPELLEPAETLTPAAPAVLTPAGAETPESPARSVRATPETLAALSAQMARRLDDGITRFELELNPSELGRVDVRLEIDASGGIRAAFTFERPSSASELGRRADELQKSLESAGFNLSGGLSFDVAGDRSHSRHSTWAEAREDRAHSPAAPEPDLSLETSTLIADALSGRRPPSRSGVDIRI